MIDSTGKALQVPENTPTSSPTLPPTTPSPNSGSVKSTSTPAPTKTPISTPSANPVAPINQDVLNTQKTLNQQNKNTPGYIPLKEDGILGPKTSAAIASMGSKTSNGITTPDTSKDTAKTTTDATTGTSTTKTPEQIALDTAITDKAAKDKEIADQAKIVSDQILGIQNGTIPLSAGDQAQITGLQQQFQQLIDQQVLTNSGASGLANTRGYQTGSAEYDPSFQVKTIGSIVSAGVAKITDLQVKEASAVAALTQALKDNNIKAIKDAYNIMDDARKNTQTAIQKTIDDAQAKIKEINDANQKIKDDVAKIAEEAAKAGAPKDIVNKIATATNVMDAIGATGGYLQSSSNPDIAKYLQYKRDMEAKGLVPLDYGSFQDNQDKKTAQNKINEAYGVAKATAQGKAAGTPSGITEDENGNLIATGNLSTLDIGRYNLAGTRATKVFRDSQAFKAATNAGFYVGKINAAVNNTGSIGDQEILDAISQFNTGGGRVTESQVNLILKGKSFGDTVSSWTNKVKTGGILSDNQRKQALALAKATSDEFIKNYEAKYKPLEEKLKAQKIPKEFWGIPSPEELKGESPDNSDPVKLVDDWVASNPDKVAKIQEMYNIPGTNDQDVWDYIQLTYNQKP